MSQTWENAHQRGIVRVGTRPAPLLAMRPGPTMPNPVGLRGQLTPLGQFSSDATEPLYPAAGSPLVQPDPLAGQYFDPVLTQHPAGYAL